MFTDHIGLRLLAPDESWRRRPDMDPDAIKKIRAAIVARARLFLLPIEPVEEEDRPGFSASAQGAKASGTPFVSFYTPEEMLALARDTGFEEVRHVPGTSLGERYFADRADALRPSSGEDFVVATS